MYLEIIKATTRYWGIKDTEPGVYPLQCCAAAGADLEARGLLWDVDEAIEAYAYTRRSCSVRVRHEMAELCRRHKLPSVPEVARYLAKQAERLEADAAGFAWGARE